MASQPATRLRRLLIGVRAAWVSVGVAMLLLVLAEGAARLALAFRAPAPDPRLRADAYPSEPWVAGLYDENRRSSRMRWESYTYWRRAPFAGRYINIDEHGLRRTWRGPVSPAGKPLRISVFGGSTVWGTGVRDEHTIPSELARYLDATGVRSEVTNLGESGYVSTQAVIALLRELQAGRIPDLAVFYIGINDTASAVQNGEPGLPQSEDHRRREFNLLRRERSLVLEAWRGASAHSVLLRLLRPAPPIAAPAAAAPQSADEVRRVIDANLRAVAGLAERFDFQFSVFWEPCSFLKPTHTPWEQSQLSSAEPFRAWFLAVYAGVQADWARRSPAEVTYLGDLFGNTTGPRFIDASHLGEAGTREVAIAIGEQLIRHRRLKPRAPQPSEQDLPAPKTPPAP